MAKSPKNVNIYYKYSTFPCGISINIVPKVGGIYPEAKGRGEYSLPDISQGRVDIG